MLIIEYVYFSIIDVIGLLTDQPDVRHAAKYWCVLKIRLKAEDSELTTKCSQLKLKAADGKRRLTDVADTEQLLRIIQSIVNKIFVEVKSSEKADHILTTRYVPHMFANTSCA